MKVEIPPYLCSADPQAYLVGGSVRDLVRGATPKDYDIAVLGDAVAYAGRLATRLGTRVIPLGEPSHRIFRLVAGPACIDISPAKGGDIQADLQRRDFTINALACNLCDGRIVDTTGGLDDLSRHTVRMVSPTVFQDDPARLVRAYRMAATLDFQIEPTTLRAIGGHAAAIEAVAGERVWSELRVVLAAPRSHGHILSMSQTGLLSAILPPLALARGCRQNRHHAYDVLDHTLHAYAAMEKVFVRAEDYFDPPADQLIKDTEIGVRAVLKLALLLHDAGKPARRTVDASGTPHFYGHVGKSAQIALDAGLRLKLSGNERRQLIFIVQNHQRPLSLFLSGQSTAHAVPPRALGRFLRHCGGHTPYLLLHAMADHMGKGVQDSGMTDFLRKLMAAYFEKQVPPQKPLLNGQDIMNTFGISPSAKIGDVLRRVEEARLSGTIDNRQQAMAWVAAYLAAEPKTAKRR